MKKLHLHVHTAIRVASTKQSSAIVCTLHLKEQFRYVRRDRHKRKPFVSDFSVASV